MLVADGWSSTGSLRTEGGEEQQPDADHYRGVGGVEDVPEAEVDVVRDLSAAQTVEEVACGAAQDQTAPEHCERRWSPRRRRCFRGGEPSGFRRTCRRPHRRSLCR